MLRKTSIFALLAVSILSAQTVNFTARVRPETFGKVTVVTSGTPVKLTSAMETAGIVPPGANFAVNKFYVAALSGNTGSIYLGYAGMNKTTLVGVIKILAPGDFLSITEPQGGNVYYANKLYVDAATSGDSVYGFADQK